MAKSIARKPLRANPYADPEFREKVRTSARFLNALRWNQYLESTKDREDVPYVADATCEKCGEPFYPIGWASPVKGAGEPSIVLHCPDCMVFTSFRVDDPTWWILRETTVWPEGFAGKLRDAKRLLLEAGQKMNEKDFASAIPLLRKSFKLDPFNAVTAYTLAVALEEIGEIHVALKYHAKACELDRFVMEYRLQCGSALLKAGQLDRAQNVFSEAIDRRLHERFNWTFDRDPRAQSPDPELTRAYIGLGLSFEKQKQWEQAKDAYIKATEEDPEHPYAYWYLGGAYHGLGQPEEAAEALEDAVRNQPDRAEIHYELGNEYLALHEPDLAETCFRDALRLKPDNAEAQLTLAYAFDEQGKIHEAIVLYEHLVEYHPDCIPAYTALGYALHKTGKGEEGLGWMQKAIELAPNEPIAYEGLGFILIELGRPEAAIDSLQFAWKELAWVNAGYRLGVVYRRQKKWDKAIRVLNDVIRQQPFFPNAYFELGNDHAAIGDIQKAIEYFEKAISQSPGHTEAMLELGLLYVAEKDDSKVTMIVETLTLLDKPKADILQGRLAAAIQLEVDDTLEADR